MKISRKFLVAAFLMVFAAQFCNSAFADTARRLRFMGTANLSMPTGYARSSMYYINDAGHSSALFSQALMNGFLELSYLRHMNGAEDGKSVMNLKVKILEEDTLIPGVVWGVSDLNTQLGSKIFYFSASKAIEAFGVHLHAGFYKDPISTEHKNFFGVEKMIFPLVTVAAERNDDKDTFGIKLSPYPGFSLEFSQRDSKEEMYNLVYFRSF